MLRRLFQTLGLVGISVLLCAGDWYSVQVTTSDQSGLNARFAFDLTNTNDTLNCVYLTDLDSDAKIQDVYTIGGGHDDWELFHFGFLFDASVGLCDSAGGFFNGIVVDVDSLGTYMSFGAEFDPVYTNVPGARDRFAFYFLGAFDHVLATDDTLASALFTLTLNDDGSQDLTVFYPMTFTAPDELTLDLGDLTGTPREEGPPRILQAGPESVSTRSHCRIQSRSDQPGWNQDLRCKGWSLPGALG